MNDAYRGTACVIRLRRFVWSVMGFWTVAVGAALLIQRAETIGHTAGYAAVWLLGMLGIAAASRPLCRRVEQCQEAEGALRETQTRIRETAAHIPGVVYQFVMRPDETYTFPYVSEGVTRILGMTPEQVRQDPTALFPGVLYQEDIEAIFESIRESARNMTTWQRELQCKSTRGEIKWIRAASSPHSLPDGSVLFNGVFLDITDLKEAEGKLEEARGLLEQRVAERTAELEEANRELQKEIVSHRQAEQWLLESEERFRSYFELGLVGMAIISAEKDWLEVNHRLCTMLGYTEQELFGKSWDELTHPDDREAEAEQFRRVLGGVTDGYSMDKRLLHKNGQTVFTNLSVRCFRRPDETVDSLVTLVQDITQRKLAEDNLRKEKDLSEATLDSLPGVFYTFDDQGNYLRWNKNLERISGYSGEEISRMNPLDFVCEPDRKLVEERLREVFAQGQFMVEAGFLSKDGKETPFFFTGVRHQIGEKTCLLGMGIDISERRRAEEEARLTQQQVLDLQRREKEHVEAELEKARDRLVRHTRLATLGQVSASIAHELRSPLSVIRNTAFLLKKKLPLTERQWREHVDTIERKAAEAGRIISELVAMSRGSKPIKKACNLTAIVGKARAALQPPRAIRWHIACQGEPFMIHVDGGQFEQVMRNLFANAIRALGQSGNITVATARSDEHDEIVVSNDGPAIPEEHHAEIFEPLFSGEQTGTGLGLTVCRQIVQRHGGTIEVTSNERGAAFVIRLPVKHDEDEAAAAPATPLRT